MFCQMCLSYDLPDVFVRGVARFVGQMIYQDVFVRCFARCVCQRICQMFLSDVLQRVVCQYHSHIISKNCILLHACSNQLALSLAALPPPALSPTGHGT